MKRPVRSHPEDTGPMLRVAGIHAGYGKREVLRGISLDVHDGEILALLGPNGAGKSTLLRVVAGLLAPERGSVSFLDKEITYLAAHRRIRGRHWLRDPRSVCIPKSHSRRAS